MRDRGGTAIYAGSVQFPPVHLDGRTFLPSQANNLYIFLAVGMAIYAQTAARVAKLVFDSDLARVDRPADM